MSFGLFLALASGLMLFGQKSGGGGGASPTTPAGYPGPGGGGGGSGGGGSPPFRPPPPPRGPAPGLWSPDDRRWPNVQEHAFPGRAAVWALRDKENEPGDAPLERPANILRLAGEGWIDAPRWVRIPVREGLEVEVMGDVLSAGGVRLCSSEITAQNFADMWDALIMTPGIADAVWKARTITLPPKPISQSGNPGGATIFLLYYADLVETVLGENLLAIIQKDGAEAAAKAMTLIATLGKDYVLDARVPQNPDQCAIYGWHNTNGTPIQSAESGASFKHHLAFYDYSQMIRLVRRRAWLNGAQVDLADIYQKQPALVSYKGLPSGPIPIRHPKVPPLAGTGVRV